tara:strand:+ start:212 stop:487 length:276 start_codon:yes stop_codon:yes gene_type:complete
MFFFGFSVVFKERVIRMNDMRVASGLEFVRALKAEVNQLISELCVCFLHDQKKGFQFSGACRGGESYFLFLLIRVNQQKRKYEYDTKKRYE